MFDLPHRRAILVLALLGLVACSGDGTTGGNTSPISQDIVAAKGGTVADPGNDVTLTIPAGSLGDDTKITLTVTSKTADTVTDVYAFAPAGLAFEIPATLKIDTAGVSVPADKKAVLAVQEGASWSEVSGSVQGSGGVEAPVSLLATYSVILVEAASGPCDAACMSQADAVCCTTCGCTATVSCAPQCGTGTKWDCEVGCCFDYDALMCAP